MSSILKVSTLKDPTNSNTAMSIDASGRILTPARPAFFAYRSFGDQADTNYTNYTVVDFDATKHNIGNC